MTAHNRIVHRSKRLAPEAEFSPLWTCCEELEQLSGALVDERDPLGAASLATPGTEHGIAYDERLMAHGDYSRASGEAGRQRLLAQIHTEAPAAVILPPRSRSAHPLDHS